MLDVEETRDIMRDIFLNTKNFLLFAKEKYETIEELKNKIHKHYSNEIKNIEKNWIQDINLWKKIKLNEKQIKAYVKSLKFNCLTMIHMAEEQGYTKTQDVLDLVEEKIKAFNF